MPNAKYHKQMKRDIKQREIFFRLVRKTNRLRAIIENWRQQIFKEGYIYISHEHMKSYK